MRAALPVAALCMAGLLAGPLTAPPPPGSLTARQRAPLVDPAVRRSPSGPTLELSTGARGPCDPPPAGPAGAATDVGRLLRLREVHRLATGVGQTIAVIDTGVAPHERLAGRLAGGGDLLAGGDGRADCDGHGTAVAGLLAAAPGPDDDLVGMAPAATVLTIRNAGVAAWRGVTRAGDVDTLGRAITLAVERGATVVNISEAGCLPERRAATGTETLRAALRLAARGDAVVVAAAGNIGPGACVGGAAVGEVSLPGWFDAEVLTVAAVEPDGTPSAFTVPGPWVDVAAPGTGLRTLAAGGDMRAGTVDGTSFAAPWVAGLAALVRERFPELGAREVVDRILATAARPPGGRSDAVGYGMIDPVTALTAPSTGPAPGDAATPPTAVLAGAAPAAPPNPRPASGLLLLAAVSAAATVAALLRARGGARAAPGR